MKRRLDFDELQFSDWPIFWVLEFVFVFFLKNKLTGCVASCCNLNRFIKCLNFFLCVHLKERKYVLKINNRIDIKVFWRRSLYTWPFWNICTLSIYVNTPTIIYLNITILFFLSLSICDFFLKKVLTSERKKKLVLIWLQCLRIFKIMRVVRNIIVEDCLFKIEV